MNAQSRPVSYEILQQLLKPRERDSHKGTYGHALIVGGAPGFGGAALMAAEAAARCGAGLTSVATHPSHAPAFLSRHPELMVRGIENMDVINPMIRQASVLIAGPGLGQGAWGVQLLQAAMEAATDCDIPVVLDADALNMLSRGQLTVFAEQKSKWILTPHPGEAARLLRVENRTIQDDREAAVRTLQDRFGGVAVLKGSGTLICYQQSGRQQVETCVHGNPGMASGGMGDVLSGIIGGLLAQGFSMADSTRLGVCVHSKAADLEAAVHGERGMQATDLITHLRKLLNP